LTFGSRLHEYIPEFSGKIFYSVTTRHGNRTASCSSYESPQIGWIRNHVPKISFAFRAIFISLQEISQSTGRALLSSEIKACAFQSSRFSK
jgi:hypothetical protein